MYYVTDWQGNNVAVVDKDGKVMQRTVYYPDAIKGSNGKFERIDPGNGSKTNLKDAQKILDSMTYRAELQGIEVYGKGVQRQLRVPTLDINLSPNTRKLELLNKDDFR